MYILFALLGILNYELGKWIAKKIIQYRKNKKGYYGK